MLAVDQHRACDAHGHLHDAGEVLDVARHVCRIERELAHVLQRRAGLLQDELAARKRALCCVVVFFIAGNFRPGHVAGLSWND
jgi:hypothetical protein